MHFRRLLTPNGPRMTNDILEQVAEDYFRSQGYFTQHNVPYQPELKGSQYAVGSDIDILAVNPTEQDKAQVVAVSCKSWQNGVNIPKILEALDKNPNKIIAGKECWKSFRELARKEWAKALRKEVHRLTGRNVFTFCLAVIRFTGGGDPQAWERAPLFKKNLPGCDIWLLDLRKMVNKLYGKLDTTPAHSELSRLLQLVKAGGGEISYELPKKYARDGN